MGFHPNAQLRLLEEGFEPLALLRQSLSKGTPWNDIIEFATSPQFCGQSLYPRQQTLLRLIYLETENMTDYDIEVINEWREHFGHRLACGVQPDVWERIAYLKHRGYRRFPHVQAVLGRRASKGFVGAILAAEQIAYLIALDNPQKNFNIREGKDLFLNVGATSQTQAQRHQFADIRDVVEHCAWLQPYIAETKDHQMRLRTPADLRKVAQLKANDVPVEHVIASLWVVALSASSVAGRGATSMANFFDEFAFHVQGTSSVKSGEEIYEDWQPSLGQLKKDALTYVPSSPFSKVGKFYELYQQGRVLMRAYDDDSAISAAARAEIASMRMRADLDETELTADPTMLIVQGPSWMLYQDWERGNELTAFQAPFAPENDLRDEEQQRRQLKNPEKFSVERLGQFAEVSGQYLDSAKVDAIFRPVPWRDPSVLVPTPFGRFDYSYRIHCDPSKTGANFALAIAHTEIAPCDRCGTLATFTEARNCTALTCDGMHWPHVIIDRLHVWRAIDFPRNAETNKHEIDYTVIERELDDILHTFPSTTKFSADQWNCLKGSTLVPTEHGLLRLDELAEAGVGDIVDLDVKVQAHHEVAVARQGFHKGSAKTRKITTKIGTVIEATPEHRLWVRKGKAQRWHRDKAWGFQHVRDIEVGDWLCVKRNTVLPAEEFDMTGLPHWGPRRKAETWVQTCDENLGEALGLLLAEGNYTPTWCNFGNSDDEVLERYRTLMEKCFSGTWTSRTTDTWKGRYHYGQVRKEGRAAMLLHDLGLKGTSTEKTVPWVIRQSSAPVVRAFLRGYFEGDGGVCFGREGEAWVEATTTSEEVGVTLQQLLLSVGVISTRWSGTYRYRGETRQQWRIKIYGPDLMDFAEKVGFFSSRKTSELEMALGMVGPRAGHRSKNQRHGDEYWVRVTSIEESEADCYDLSVPGPVTYVANGMVSHNSVGFLQRLRKKYMPSIRVVEETATEKSNWVRAEKFKSAINLGWLHSYADTMYDNGGSLLEMECKFLSESNGKVVKQDIGPVQTKDLYDSVSVVTTDLLATALERWESGRLTAHAVGSTNVAGLRSGREYERGGPQIGVRNLYTDGHRGTGNQAWDSLASNELSRRRGRLTPARPGAGRTRGTSWPRGY